MIVDYPRRLDSLGGSALLRNLETLGLLSVSTFFSVVLDIFGGNYLAMQISYLWFK